MNLRILAAILIASSLLAAEEKLKSNVIDPSSGRLYGHALPKSPADCVDSFGEPTLRATVGKITILGYGNYHLFVFDGGHFRELRIDSFTHFGGIQEWIGSTHPLDNVSYRILPGLECEMPLDKIVSNLKAAGIVLKEGKESTKWRSDYWYRDGSFEVNMEFRLYSDGSALLGEVSIRSATDTQSPKPSDEKLPRQSLPKSTKLTSSISLTESSLYGLPIPKTPNELRTIFGEPTYLASCGPHSIFGFGLRHVFAFTNGNLSAVKIAGMHDCLNYGLSDWLEDIHELDAHGTFTIEPGISEKMQYEAIRDAFRKSGNVYRLTGESDRSPTELGYVIEGFHVGIEYSNYVDNTVGISEIRIAPLHKKTRTAQDGSDQPATVPESNPAGDLKTNPESEAHSQ